MASGTAGAAVSPLPFLPSSTRIAANNKRRPEDRGPKPAITKYKFLSLTFSAHPCLLSVGSHTNGKGTGANSNGGGQHEREFFPPTRFVHPRPPSDTNGTNSTGRGGQHSGHGGLQSEFSLQLLLFIRRFLQTSNCLSSGPTCRLDVGDNFACTRR
jgi:hypothetical protein